MNAGGNIPAVCRIKGRGTATLISPGILLTSNLVVGSKADAANLVAVFFEGTKKNVVEVRLLPHEYFFASVCPDHIDYCLVACEVEGIRNVTPVLLPLTKKEWPQVREGDIILAIQHPMREDPIPGTDFGSAGPAHTARVASRSVAADGVQAGTVTHGLSASMAPGAEGAGDQTVKRFEEVMRCRNDIFYLKANGSRRTSGCPAFNDAGQLVGMQSQQRIESEGVVNRVLSIVSIVTHCFVNGQLSRIKRSVTAEDLWDTWYISNDVARVVSIMANFTEDRVTKMATERLCEFATIQELIPAVRDCGGVQVIMRNLQVFGKADKDLCIASLRALWSISVVSEGGQLLIADGSGIDTILVAMESHVDKTVAEFGTVLMYNLSECALAGVINFGEGFVARVLRVVVEAMQSEKDSNALQKFGLGLCANLVRLNRGNAVLVAQSPLVEHAAWLAESKPGSIFVVEGLMGLFAALTQCSESTDIIAQLHESASLHHRGSHDTIPLLGGGSTDPQSELVEHGADGEGYGLGHGSGMVVSGKLLPRMIGSIIALMLRYRDNNTILLHGNHALWGLGRDPVARGLILEHPDGAKALSISLPALLASTQVFL